MLMITSVNSTIYFDSDAMEKYRPTTKAEVQTQNSKDGFTLFQFIHSLGIKPMTMALLVPCSTVCPTGIIAFVMMKIIMILHFEKIEDYGNINYSYG